MNLGPAELLVIVLFALLIVGPGKLPQVGKTLGEAIRQFRGAQDKVNDTLKKEGLDPQSIKEMSNNPFLALDKIGEVADKVAAVTVDESSDQTQAEEPASASASDGVAADTPQADASQAAAIAAGTAAAAQTAESAGPTVAKLSDIETFTQRKMRLQAQRSQAVDQTSSQQAKGGMEQPGE